MSPIVVNMKTRTSLIVFPAVSRNSIGWITTYSVFVFTLLFGYAAFSKLMASADFKLQLFSTPYIGVFSNVLIWSIPISELMVALMLNLSFLRLTGLYAFTTMMGIFTVYIAIMLVFSAELPCICGGILSGMSWLQHFIFNFFFFLWGLFILLLYKLERLPQKSKYSSRNESGIAEHLDTK